MGIKLNCPKCHEADPLNLHLLGCIPEGDRCHKCDRTDVHAGNCGVVVDRLMELAGTEGPGPVDLRTYVPSAAVALGIKIVAGHWSRLSHLSRRATNTELLLVRGAEDLLLELAAAESGLDREGTDLVELIGEWINEARES